MGFKEGDLVLLSTRNLKMKSAPNQLQKRFVGPFRVIETIGEQAYRLSLPENWKIHPVFHVSLLREWKAVQTYRRIDQFSRMTYQRSKNRIGKLKGFYGGEKQK